MAYLGGLDQDVLEVLQFVLETIGLLVLFRLLVNVDPGCQLFNLFEDFIVGVRDPNRRK